MQACLISDIYGAHGRSTAYMQAWQALLRLRGWQATPVFLNELCPAAYRPSAAQGFDLEATHRHFVDGGIGLAAAALQAILAAHEFDLVLGFSLGGYLAALARPHLHASTAIVCISATRLRLCQSLPGEAAIHAVFGADDPWRPQGGLQLGGRLCECLIPQAGHEVYLSPDRCRFVLDFKAVAGG